MTRSNRFRRKLTRHKKKIVGGASRKSKSRDRRRSRNTRRQQLIIAGNLNTQTDAPPSRAVVDSMLQSLRDLAHTRPDITTHPSVRLVAPNPVQSDPVQVLCYTLGSNSNSVPTCVTYAPAPAPAPVSVPILALSRHSSRSPTHLSKKQRKH
jgi:hypothetical protein